MRPPQSWQNKPPSRYRGAAWSKKLLSVPGPRISSREPGIDDEGEANPGSYLGILSLARKSSFRRVCFGEGNCYTRASHHRTRRSLWQPTKPGNAHIRFVRVRSLRRSIAARSARRWKKSRTWIASALTRSARVERNTRPTHSHRRRPTRRIHKRLLGPVQSKKLPASGSQYQHVRYDSSSWRPRL
jgi:hypothetical protein